MFSAMKTFSYLVVTITLCLLAPMAKAAPLKPSQQLRDVSGRLSFHRAGQHVAITNGPECQIWNLKNNQKLKTITTNEPLVGSNYSADGRYLVVATNGEYTLWNTANYRPLRVIKDAPQAMAHQPFSISPDGRFLAVGKLRNNLDYPDGQQPYNLTFSVHLWNTQTGKKVAAMDVATISNTMPGHPPAREVAFHPSGDYLAAVIDPEQSESRVHTLKIFNLRTGRWAWSLPGAPPLSYSTNGQYLAFTSPTALRRGGKSQWRVKLWNLWAHRFRTLWPAPLEEYALSPDGRWLVGRYVSETVPRGEAPVRLFHTSNLQPSRTFSDETTGFCFHPQSSILAANSLYLGRASFGLYHLP
jgi:WD40 repeat protein